MTDFWLPAGFVPEETLQTVRPELVRLRNQGFSLVADTFERLVADRTRAVRHSNDLRDYLSSARYHLNALEDELSIMGTLVNEFHTGVSDR